MPLRSFAPRSSSRLPGPLGAGMVRGFFLVGALLAGSGALSSRAEAQGLTNYNVFTFGGFSQQNTEVNGTLAVGGNFSMQSSSVGTKLTTKPANGVLVVGGTTSITDGTVFKGDSYLASAPTVSGATLQGTTNVGAIPVDFVSEYARLSTLSSQVAALAANSVGPTALYSQLWFYGTQEVNYFTVSAAMLAGAFGGYNFHVPDGASIIVNVVDVTDGMTLFQNTGFNFCNSASSATSFGNCAQVNGDNPGGMSSRLLWNIETDVPTSVAFAGSMRGSVLAPNVHLNANYGSCNGDFVLRSATSNCEFYMNAYQGYVPPPVRIPEPASWALTALGVSALAWRLRRRAA